MSSARARSGGTTMRTAAACGTSSLAEAPLGPFAPDVGVGGGDDARVEHALLAALVEREQRGLLGRGGLVDAVDEQGEGVGTLRQAGERGALVRGQPEVDGRHRRRGEARARVDGPRDEAAARCPTRPRAPPGRRRAPRARAARRPCRIESDWPSTGPKLVRSLGGDRHGDVAGQELQGAAPEAHLGAHREHALLHLDGPDEGAAVAAEVAHPDAAGHEGDLQVVLADLRVAQDEVVVGVRADEQRARFKQGLSAAVGPAGDPHTHPAHEQRAARVGHQDACERGEAQWVGGAHPTRGLDLRVRIEQLSALLRDHLHVTPTITATVQRTLSTSGPEGRVTLHAGVSTRV
jgi:hypothetical protein